VQSTPRDPLLLRVDLGFERKPCFDRGMVVNTPAAKSDSLQRSPKPPSSPKPHCLRVRARVLYRFETV
jgi:hypothetical protein